MKKYIIICSVIICGLSAFGKENICPRPNENIKINKDKFVSTLIEMSKEENILIMNNDKFSKFCACSQLLFSAVVSNLNIKNEPVINELYDKVCAESHDLKSKEVLIANAKVRILKTNYNQDSNIYESFSEKSIFNSIRNAPKFPESSISLYLVRNFKEDEGKLYIPKFKSKLGAYSQIITESRAKSGYKQSYHDELELVFKNLRPNYDSENINNINKIFADRFNRVLSITSVLNENTNIFKSINDKNNLQNKILSSFADKNKSTVESSSTYEEPITKLSLSQNCFERKENSCGNILKSQNVIKTPTEDSVCLQNKLYCKSVDRPATVGSPEGVGVLEEKCVATWEDDYQPMSSNFDIRTMKFTQVMKKTSHCIQLKAVGPISFENIAKEYVSSCINKAKNDKATLYAAGLIAALYVDVGSNGATKGAATAVLVEQWLTNFTTVMLDCIQDTDAMKDKIVSVFKDKFTGSVSDIKHDIYWNIIDTPTIDDMGKLANKMLTNPRATVDEILDNNFNQFYAHLPIKQQKELMEFQKTLYGQVQSGITDGMNKIIPGSGEAINRALGRNIGGKATEELYNLTKNIYDNIPRSWKLSKEFVLDQQFFDPYKNSSNPINSILNGRVPGIDVLPSLGSVGGGVLGSIGGGLIKKEKKKDVISQVISAGTFGIL